MYESTQSLADVHSQHRLPVYRVIMLDGSGAVFSMMRLSAADDEQAIARAKTMFDGHAVELWDGLRFIDHFAPVE